jgi:hypothetical protein
MPARYLWRGILVIVLGATLIKSATAQIGIGTAAAGFNGSVMSHSLRDIAALLVVAVVYLYELSRICVSLEGPFPPDQPKRQMNPRSRPGTAPPRDSQVRLAAWRKSPVLK